MTAIADATVLIGLHQIGHLFLLPALFDTVLVPPAVVEESKRSVPRQDILRLAKVAKLIANVREPLDSLRASGFRLSDPVYNAVLLASGEIYVQKWARDHSNRPC